MSQKAVTMLSVLFFLTAVGFLLVVNQFFLA